MVSVLISWLESSISSKMDRMGARLRKRPLGPPCRWWRVPLQIGFHGPAVLYVEVTEELKGKVG